MSNQNSIKNVKGEFVNIKRKHLYLSFFVLAIIILVTHLGFYRSLNQSEDFLSKNINLLAENGDLQTQNADLLAENFRLSQENQSLQTQNTGLLAENQDLLAESTRLRKGKHNSNIQSDIVKLSCGQLGDRLETYQDTVQDLLN